MAKVHVMDHPLIAHKIKLRIYSEFLCVHTNLMKMMKKRQIA